MSAPVLTEAPAELPYDAFLIGQAHGVFDHAKSAEWPEPDRKAIGGAFLDLGAALKAYWDLRNGIVPAWFPGMTPGPEGFARALRMAAENAWEKAEELTRAELISQDRMAALSGEGETL
jgi:hypothetical protein